MSVSQLLTGAAGLPPKSTRILLCIIKFYNKIAGNHESENFRSLSDIMLEEARLEWEKEKKELLEKQIQLQKQNEELQELVDDLKGR